MEVTVGMFFQAIAHTLSLSYSLLELYITTSDGHVTPVDVAK